MNKLHIAISTDNIEVSIEDYSKRFEIAPFVVLKGTYSEAILI